jgi:hypothetical protein
VDAHCIGTVVDRFVAGGSDLRSLVIFRIYSANDQPAHSATRRTFVTPGVK